MTLSTQQKSLVQLLVAEEAKTTDSVTAQAYMTSLAASDDVALSTIAAQQPLIISKYQKQVTSQIAANTHLNQQIANLQAQVTANTAGITSANAIIAEFQAYVIPPA